MKLRFIKLISLYQFLLRRYQRRFCLPSIFFLQQHKNKENFEFCIQSFAKTITFFYFYFYYKTNEFGGNFKNILFPDVQVN